MDQPVNRGTMRDFKYNILCFTNYYYETRIQPNAYVVPKKKKNLPAI